MAKIVIYGRSDDLVEIEGDLREEFSHYSDDAAVLAFSEGTLLSIEYTDSGIWRINRIACGGAAYSKVEGVDADGEDYSDRVTLEGDIQWVVFGEQHAVMP